MRAIKKQISDFFLRTYPGKQVHAGIMCMCVQAGVTCHDAQRVTNKEHG